MITFTRLDLDKALIDKDASLSDSVSFNTRRTIAVKKALADQQARYRAAADPYILRDTIGGTAIPLGTAAFTTTAGAVYKVALPTDGQRLAGDDIFLEVSAGEFVKVGRISPDALIPTGGTPTTLGFWETKGFVTIYVATGSSTGTPSVHFLYVANLTVPAADADVLDILPEDFQQLTDATSGYLSNN